MDDDDLSPPSDPPIVNMSQQEIDQKIKEVRVPVVASHYLMYPMFQVIVYYSHK